MGPGLVGLVKCSELRGLSRVGLEKKGAEPSRVESCLVGRASVPSRVDLGECVERSELSQVGRAKRADPRGPRQMGRVERDEPS